MSEKEKILKIEVGELFEVNGETYTICAICKNILKFSEAVSGIDRKPIHQQCFLSKINKILEE